MRTFRCLLKTFLTLNAIELQSNKMINDIISINFKKKYEILPKIALIKGRVRIYRFIPSFSFLNTRT